RDAEAVRRRVWRLTLLLTAAVTLAGGAAALVIARRLSRPLTDLVAGTRRLAAGDWGYQAAVPASGEMAELRASFNAMVRQLRQQREQLEEHNRMLEAGVRQRTDELHRKDQALAQSEKLASLGLLAAGVAHELNNPLTSIVMTTNLLLEELDATSPLARDLRRIDAAAGRCRRIIDDLRAFARIRQVERVATDVRTVVDQAVATSAHELGRAGLALSCDLPADLPPVLWDPGRMVQVLTNLLANAAQAVGADGRIVVRARRVDGWLTLEVEDTGPGITPADRTRIFDPFFTTKPDGTGLGLSITHGIVGDHGGRIEVVSRTREEAGPDGATGTVVRIVLPAGEGPA
ncbi:MAG TPA: ATP-binding protein, partial [Vicinamibacteria bacterium]